MSDPTTILLALACIFGTNLLPAFGPPTVALLLFFSVNTSAPHVPLVLGGALAAASGRLILAHTSRRLRSRFSEKRRESLSAAQELLTANHWRTIGGLTLFVLSPLPSAQLFVSAGLLNVPLLPLTAAFFSGRIVSYAVYVAGASLAEASMSDVITASFQSPAGIAIQVLLLGAIVLLVRVDWVRLVRRGPSEGPDEPLPGPGTEHGEATPPAKH